jgi:hypothetical protein
MVGDIPWRIGHCPKKSGLIPLDDRYIGIGGTTPYMDKQRKMDSGELKLMQN